MRRAEKIQALTNKFSAGAIEQAVWLETHTTEDINAVEDRILDKLYLRYFPPSQKMSDRVYQLEIEKRIKYYRSVILKEAEYMGMYTPKSWDCFNRFMKNRSILKKQLNEYRLDEFGPLIAQFKKMRDDFDRRKMAIGSREWCLYFGFPDVNLN